MSGFGLGPWGTSLWGVGAPVPVFFLAYAAARATNCVRVQMSRDALNRSALGDGDALNPRAWRIEQLDSTGAVARVHFVLGVARVNAQEFDLFILGDLSAYPSTYRAVAVRVRDALGVLSTAPYNAAFFGCNVTPAQSIERAGDLLNDALAGGEGGTLVVGADGDYAHHSGADLVLKLVLRRLASQRGSWLLWSPAYGLGIRVKSPMRAATLVEARTDIEAQLRAEPEVSDFTTALEYANGVLSLRLNVRLRSTGAWTGETVTQSVEGFIY